MGDGAEETAGLWAQPCRGLAMAVFLSCPGSVRAGERGTGLRRGGRRRVEHGILLARARLCGGRQVPSDVSRSTRAAEAVGGALDDRLGATSLIAAEDGLLVSTSFDGAKRLRWAHTGGKIGRGELTARREARGRDEETERRQSAGEVVDGDGRGWGGLGEVRRGQTRANKALDSDSGAGHSLFLPSLFGLRPLLLPEHRAAEGEHPTLTPTLSAPLVLGSALAGAWKVASVTRVSVRGKTGKCQPRRRLEHPPASGARLSLVHLIAEQNWPMPSQPRRLQPEQGLFRPREP